MRRVVVRLELDELREGRPAVWGRAGELAVVRVQQLLVVLLGEVGAGAHGADGVAVAEEGVGGRGARPHAQPGHVLPHVEVAHLNWMVDGVKSAFLLIKM